VSNCFILDVSNPSSENYGKWLSKDEVTDLFSPDGRHALAISRYLMEYNITDFSINKNRDIISANIPGTVAEEMFNTKFYRYRHSNVRDIEILRVSEPYYLPESIAPYVDIVGEFIRFPTVKSPIITEPIDNGVGVDAAFSSCGGTGYTTPEVLTERYGISALSSYTKGNSMAVAEFQYQYYDDADLTNFASKCGTSKTSVTTTYGGNNANYCSGGLERCVEALLDIEYIATMAYPVPLSVYYSSTYSLLDWIESVEANTNPELVHSVSYGNDEVQQTSTAYMQSVNDEFMKVGAQGISILFAAGDQGVWGRTGVSATTFNPDFPAGSPYVTAVGGTDFVTKSVIGDEMAWTDGGGGFSDTFTQPSWQSSAVSTYLSTASLPPSRYYNSAGRGYPDVAALGGTNNPYFVAYSGGAKTAGVGGTSASCPVVAAVFAQLNDIRLKNGKSSLGFLNPFIYQYSSAFNDVTSGTNSGAGSYGFEAVAGWDPATGVGTPNFAKLSALMNSV